jgi:nitrogen fixation/metabolism regulation signal transduction histidine kinase
VIQQLKQQKHELLVQSQAEQQRARTSENFSHAVLSNLSCGVLVFGANGLVKRLILRQKGFWASRRLPA